MPFKVEQRTANGWETVGVETGPHGQEQIGVEASYKPEFGTEAAANDWLQQAGVVKGSVRRDEFRVVPA